MQQATTIQEAVLQQNPVIFENQRLFEDMLEECFQIQLYGSNKYGALKVTEGQQKLLEIFFRQRSADKPIRIIILKARQLGISSLIAVILTTEMFMRDELRCCVAAHEKTRVAEYLYAYYLNFLHYLPEPMKLLAAKKNEMGGHRLLKTRSHIACDFEAQIRGRAMDYLHLSEAAYYKDLPTFMGAVDATLALSPGTGIFMESTARGYDDDFHRRWQSAELGEDIFEPLFLAWYLHPDYQEPFANIDERGKFEDSIEKGMHDRWGNEWELHQNPDITLENLKWRRNKLTAITLDDFYREYPSTPEEAFEYTDTNVFDPPVLRWYIENDVLEPELEGEMEIDKPRFYERSPMFIDAKPPIFKVFEPPNPNSEYVLGVDTSRGKRDYCCLQVLKRRPLEQVAILRGYEGRNMIPLEFAEQLMMAWKYYNYGYLVIENNDAGLAVINNLLEWGCNAIMTHDTLFPNASVQNTDYGWNNSTKTGQEAVEKLRYQILNKNIRIHDRDTLLEMMQFVYKTTEGTGVSEGKVRAMARRKGQIKKPGDSDMGYFDDRIYGLISALLGHLVLPDPLSERDLAIEQGQTDHRELYTNDPLAVDFGEEEPDDIGFGYNPYDHMGIFDE